MHYSICVCGGGKKVVSAFVATKDAMDDVALTTNNLILEAIKIGWIPDKLTKSWEQWLLWTTTLNHAHSYLQKNVIKIINDKQTQKSSPCVRPQTYNDINHGRKSPWIKQIKYMNDGHRSYADGTQQSKVSRLHASIVRGKDIQLDCVDSRNMI